MNVFVKKAKYINNFNFEIEFNTGETKIIDIKKVKDIDKRYNWVNDENIVSKMKKRYGTIAYKSYDIAPELLYQASFKSNIRDI